VLVLKHGVGVELGQALDQPGHEAGPPGLVRGAEPGAVVAVEVLIEEDQVPPMRSSWNSLTRAIQGGGMARRPMGALIAGQFQKADAITLKDY